MCGFSSSGVGVHLAEITVVGAENVGKSSLVSALSGANPRIDNIRGSTIACERFDSGEWRWIDTPGITCEADTLASAEALVAAGAAERILAVFSALDLRKQLELIGPLLVGKHTVMVITHWDLIRKHPNAVDAIRRLREQVSIEVFAVDARRVSDEEADRIRSALKHARVVGVLPAIDLELFRSERRVPLDWPMIGPLVALGALCLPAWFSVKCAIAIADFAQPQVHHLMNPVIARVNAWPSPWADMLARDYGLISMFPFLVLYAAPTIALFGFMLALYKTTGLLDRLSYAVHPLVRPFGLTGRDVVRVIMGFGCNVPAVINTRACSVRTRGVCISAISFGSACSYQLPATLSVLSAAGYDDWAPVFLVWLAVTTMIYLRATAPSELIRANRNWVLPRPVLLSWPTTAAFAREAVLLLRQFTELALPIFVAICLGAGLLSSTGAIDVLTRCMGPAMALFNLPPDASAAVVMGAIRKDGIAIGLLDGVSGDLKVALTTPVQALTAVYLAGVALPCVVTALTIAREMSVRFAVRLLAQNLAAAVGFSMLFARIGRALT